MFSETISSQSGWNVFAGVLSHILEAKGISFWALEHCIDKVKVQRLKVSLTEDHAFTLNPGDLEIVVSEFSLSMEQHRLLIAAVLTTAIEGKLVERIASDIAREAAWAMLPIMERALTDAALRQDFRLTKIRTDFSEISSTSEQKFAHALTLIDSGNSLLHLMKLAIPFDPDMVLETIQTFEQAIELLEETDTLFRMRVATWNNWYEEAQSGVLQAEQILTSHG